jgi:zinc protease
LPLLITGYLTPSIPSSKTPKDAYTLELIATLLGGSDNGRLTKSLVKTKHIASSVEVSYDLYSKYQTQFVILGIPSNPKQLENLQTAFEYEIHSLQNNLVPEIELARIKTQLIAQKTFEKDSVFGQAMILGTLATAGLPYETDNDYLKEIEKITALDIQTVAKQYFVPNQLTIAKLYPNADMKPKQG